MRTRAQRHGDVYVLNGEKNSVLNAGAFDVFARTDPASLDWRGISAFLIPREAAGLSFQPCDDMGCRSVARGQRFLEGVEVPAENVVGRGGMTFPMIRSYPDVNRAFVARKCLGAAQRTLDETIQCVKERKPVGRGARNVSGRSVPDRRGRDIDRGGAVARLEDSLAVPARRAV